MKRFKLWAMVALVLLALIVILQNTEGVQTNLLLWNVTMPRALLLLVTLLLGFVIGLFTAAGRLRKSGK